MEKYVRKTSQMAITKSLFITIIVVISSLSCSKETQEEAGSNAVDKEKSKIDLILEQTLLPMSIENNTFVFSSEENYQKTIDFLVSIGDENFDAFEKYYGFSSLRKSDKFAEIEDKSDALLSTLLNPDTEIIIGSYKFTLDFNNEIVIANLIEYTVEGTKSVKSSEIVFNFGDDIFSIIETGDQTKANYCGQRENGISFPCSHVGGGVINVFSKYVTTGIYNTVSIHLEQDFFCIDCYPAILTRRAYTVSGESSWSNAITSGTFDGIDFSAGNQGETTERPYARSRRLDCLFLKVYGSVVDPIGSYNFSDNYSIGCHSDGESCAGYGGDK